MFNKTISFSSSGITSRAIKAPASKASPRKPSKYMARQFPSSLAHRPTKEVAICVPRRKTSGFAFLVTLRRILTKKDAVKIPDKTRPFNSVVKPSVSAGNTRDGSNPCICASSCSESRFKIAVGLFLGSIASSTRAGESPSPRRYGSSSSLLPPPPPSLASPSLFLFLDSTWSMSNRIAFCIRVSTFSGSSAGNSALENVTSRSTKLSFLVNLFASSPATARKPVVRNSLSNRTLTSFIQCSNSTSEKVGLLDKMPSPIIFFKIWSLLYAFMASPDNFEAQDICNLANSVDSYVSATSHVFDNSTLHEAVTSHLPFFLLASTLMFA